MSLNPINVSTQKIGFFNYEGSNKYVIDVINVIEMHQLNHVKLCCHSISCF